MFWNWSFVSDKEYLPDVPNCDAPPKAAGSLTVASASLEALRNAAAHHTRRFELVRQEEAQAVLRRAQYFDLVLKFKQARPFDLTKDTLKIFFDFGASPNPLKGTQGVVSILNDVSESWPPHDVRWYGRLRKSSEKETELEIRASADAPVGVWSMRVETGVKEEPNATPNEYKHPDQFYILFNPWVKEDATYMEDKALLDEYVLADVGKIWRGNYNSYWGHGWVFGQFDKAVLPAVMYILERSNIDPALRGNPINLSRMISKMVNSNDDNGVLYGRWGTDCYSDGEDPSNWTGSKQILKKYHKDQTPVRYGQCWVFAGVITTIFRALGLPSRVVTNLRSAHDTNSSLTLDKYFDQDNNLLSNSGKTEMIWNFHVWNEAWMARKDLPTGYGGWQAIDATPQETSEGSFQCGPTSLRAIRNGSVGLKYDVPFLIAMVNADVVHWKVDPTAEMGYSLIHIEIADVGRMILTKKANTFDSNGHADKDDVTALYKETEGTQLERSTLYNASSGANDSMRYFKQGAETKKGLELKLVDVDDVKVGDNFSIKVRVNNLLDEVQTLDLTLTARSVYYTGVDGNLIKKASGVYKFEPFQHETLNLVVTFEEYCDKLVERGMIKLFVIATVQETKQTWAAEEDLQIIKPKIQVMVPEKVVARKKCSFEFKFRNPLKCALTECKLSYEGPHVLTPPVTLDLADFEPEQEIVISGDITPIRKGTFELVAVFSSTQLSDITGSGSVDVQPTALKCIST